MVKYFYNVKIKTIICDGCNGEIKNRKCNDCGTIFDEHDTVVCRDKKHVCHWCENDNSITRGVKK